MKKILAFILLFFAVAGCLCCFSVASSAVKEAVVINDRCEFILNGRTLDERLTDDNEKTFIKYAGGAEITVKSAEDIGSVYIRFDRTPPVWRLSDGAKVVACGRYGFLHEFQKIDAEGVRELTLSFTEQVSIADLFILSKGDALPSFVQVWYPAEGNCDIMLLACHSDDDQLFFAGSVPDAVARGAEMQVCYFTNHWNTHSRPHELLNGLWTCGLDRYPIIGEFPDTKRSLTEEDGLRMLEDLGYTYEDMVRSQVLLLRRFKPQIVLVHDIRGEYGHGAHRLDSHSLRDAADLSDDPTKYPELAEEYGVWKVPKIYIHLYKENEIDFEIDRPLERFGGKTAYQVSQDAFRCHISQFNSRYRTWLIGTDEEPVTKGSEFPYYSPRKYGLWRSTVGKDELKIDFYEHIVLYADQKNVDPRPAPTPSQTTDPAPTEQTSSVASDTPAGSPTPSVPGRTEPADSVHPSQPADDPPASENAPSFKVSDAILTAVVCLLLAAAVVFAVRTAKKK